MAVVAGTLALAGLLPVAASGSSGLVRTGGTTATSSAEVETLASYVTTGKLKVQRRVRFLASCSVNCDVTVHMVLEVPGPNLASEPLSGSFPAGQVFEGYIKLTKSGLAFLKENKSKAKFRTEYTATDPLTGNTDTDTRAFKFK
jgi:hypothetical protein